MVSVPAPGQTPPSSVAQDRQGRALAQDDISEALLIDGQQALTGVDSSAFLVWPRIVRRLVLRERELTGLGWHVPHRKCIVVSRERLLEEVALDELGSVAAQAIPDQVILISRPDRDDLPEITTACLHNYLWRMLFHARIDRHFRNLIVQGKLTLATARSRIDRIGQSEFDEIRSVLRREGFVLPGQDDLDVYAEFAAVFGELSQFTPGWRHSYFPSMHDFEAIEHLLKEDVDFAREFAATKLPSAKAPHVPQELIVDPVAEEAVPPSGNVQGIPPESRRAERIVTRLTQQAERVSVKGNSVRAAVLLMTSLQFVPHSAREQVLEKVQNELATLTQRLQAALGFEDSEGVLWKEALFQLACNAPREFWNADARLLYDLQTVCVDHEREVSKVDLVGFLVSFGKKPLKRPLPNQREVLMSKHLRSATARLPTTGLTARQRESLSRLLHRAAKLAEEQLRRRMRPLLEETFRRVGLEPKNVPERVARRKLIEELSDVVVQRGFLTIGSLRDAMSRNELKLFDLETGQDVLKGDQLLRADWELAKLLDGVYEPGEFYMRWLQRLSSLAFGTQVGRFLTKYVAIPFGSSVVILEGLDHLVHFLAGWLPGADHVETVSTTAAGAAISAEPVVSDATHHAIAAAAHAPHAKIFMSWPAFWGLGFFMMALIHVRSFRKAIVDILKLGWKALRFVAYDFPRWFVKLPPVQVVLRSTPFVLFRRFLLIPLLATAVIALISMPYYSSWTRWGIWNGCLAFLLCVAINTRLGRDMEEVSAEWVNSLIHRIGVKFFLNLFEFIMEAFKRVLELIERFLYAVDEWLRFKSGESQLTLILKALLGVVWGAITFIIRFCVNLLIEPQINPIKHFPVVTVSHKIILPTQPLMASTLHEWFQFSVTMSNTIAALIVFMLPGAFGFLVWELKANWRLFASNRSRRILPVLVGSHGETLIRLMKPGFHSGTLPKLYSKLRKAERKAHLKRWKTAKAVYRERLHHVEESVSHFIERDLFMLLQESRGWGSVPLKIEKVEAASNRLLLEINCPSLTGGNLILAFEEQSGWLLAGIVRIGWVRDLSETQKDVFRLALAGIYKIGGVDLIREQIAAAFAPREFHYDISDRGLVIWPNRDYSVEVRYDLDERRLAVPRPKRVAREHHLPDLDARALHFSDNPILWKRWVEAWSEEQQGRPIPRLFAEVIHFLPPISKIPTEIT